ncbi:MAG TPA: LamG domain-containing protein [Terrimicrobiaceae bacterium]
MSNRHDDLVLHLKLDDIDIATNTVPDSSPLQGRASVRGADLLADDTFGACLDFGEPDDYVEVSETALTGKNPAHTIEAWIFLQTYPQERSWILLLGQESAGSHHWMVNAAGAPDPLGKKAQLGVWGEVASQAMPAISLGEWVHVATTYDGRSLASYVNGQPIDAPKSATFHFANNRLTLARRGIASERNFQGKMANVRIYKRALSRDEIQEDMNADKLSLPAYRKAHPLAFSLLDKDDNFVLYISDDPRDDHRLIFEVRNTSVEPIKFEERVGDQASKDNHHFELVFRSGVLAEKTLAKLRENKGGIVETDVWDVFSPGEDNQSGTVSLFFLSKEVGKVLLPNQRLTIPLHDVSADAGSGARGTRIELKLNQLSYVDDATPITGSRLQHVQIMNHLGSGRPPLHVGFIGSNRILNDGSSANTLVLQLMNVFKSVKDTSITLTKDSKFLISFDVQSDDEVAPWSLCTEREIEELKANESIIVAEIDENGDVIVDAKGNPVSDVGRWDVSRTDRGLGESPVWSFSPKQDVVLDRDDYIQIHICNIKTSLPSGLTNLYLEYKNIPGFWQGQIVCAIEKAPLLFYDGKVGIGKAEPQAALDVNGEIRANFFRAGEVVRGGYLWVRGLLERERQPGQLSGMKISIGIASPRLQRRDR